MVSYNNHNNIKEIHYNNHSIKYVYGCGGNLVWSGDTPTPPTPTGGTKFYATYNDSSTYSAECDGDSFLTTATTKPAGYSFVNMTDAVIGDCVTEIYDYAFEVANGQTSNLSSVTISDGVETIGFYAFHRCGKLTSVYIPSSVKTIHSGAFKYCSGLTSVTLLNGLTTIEHSVFQNCSGLTSVDIPDSVTSIGKATFGSCGALKHVNIGSGITSIGDALFEYCNAMEYVVINAVIPPSIESGTFDRYYGTFQIYVPDVSVEDYKSAQWWSAYASRIKPISEKP